SVESRFIWSDSPKSPDCRIARSCSSERQNHVAATLARGKWRLPAPATAPAAPPGGILGGLGSLIDMNHDGNPLDDILGMAGKLLR
ncbi:MAG: hypothetical protein KGM93_12485, partial [Sphingomonadales bacterium]|nr:hypothetical protein [Sphingomonadales bacterium]